MKICYNKIAEEIKNLVDTKAKYQKVMLLFDDYVSSLEIAEIYRNIKELCIFNQSNMKDVDTQELFNGYRMIIYVCGVDSFLKTQFNKDEFINVFCPRDNGILPYFLSNENKIDSNENYLILPNQKVDVGMLSSLSFNQFFSYFSSLLGINDQEIDFTLSSQEITQQNIMNAMENLDKSINFLDVDILKKCDISYDKIVLVDLLLIDAFSVFITAVKHQNLMLVDVYKVAKENGELIEKFYSLCNNEAIFNLVVLNYNCLLNYCVNKKEKILNCLNVFDFSQKDVEQVCGKIKQYAKDDDGLLAYLYLYNIFGV